MLRDRAGDATYPGDLAAVIDAVTAAVPCPENSEVHHRAPASGYTHIEKCVCRAICRISPARHLATAVNGGACAVLAAEGAQVSHRASASRRPAVNKRV